MSLSFTQLVLPSLDRSPKNPTVCRQRSMASQWARSHHQDKSCVERVRCLMRSGSYPFAKNRLVDVDGCAMFELSQGEAFSLQLSLKKNEEAILIHFVGLLSPNSGTCDTGSKLATPN